MSTLRERKKAATRTALHEAAVRLALEHGVENVTIEAIADAADVSRRTFSNYFANKEDALLHRGRRHLALLVANVRARPAGEDAWTALAEAVAALVGPANPVPLDTPAERALRRHPSLLAAQMATHVQVERDLAAAVAPRLPHGPDRDLAAQVTAGCFLTALRVAESRVAADPALDLADLVTRTVRYARGAHAD